MPSAHHQLAAFVVRADAVVAVLLDDALLTCCEVSCHSYTPVSYTHLTLPTRFAV